MKRLLYDWDGLNIQLFQALNGHQWHGADGLMVLAGYVADVWSFPFYAGMWALWVATLKRRGAEGIAVRAELQLQRFVVGFLVAVFAAGILKYSLNFLRPMCVLGELGVHVLGQFDSEHSVPSGHATFSMLLAASLWPVFSSHARTALVLFVGWVGIARVWTGAHFPADILAGYIVGAASAGLSVWIVQRAIVWKRW